MAGKCQCGEEGLKSVCFFPMTLAACLVCVCLSLTCERSRPANVTAAWSSNNARRLSQSLMFVSLFTIMSSRRHAHRYIFTSAVAAVLYNDDGLCVCVWSSNTGAD